MRRDEAVRVVGTAARGVDAAVFVGNGVLCRAAYALGDDARTFYMFGSMSLCPSLAIGYVLHSGRRAVAVEGDGNALMGMSALPLAATVSHPFVHVVLDNGVYESTGGQPSMARRVDLCAIAAGAGYRSTATVHDADTLTRLLRDALTTPHATYLRVPVDVADGPPPPRVPMHPAVIAGRFRSAHRTTVRSDRESAARP